MNIPWAKLLHPSPRQGDLGFSLVELMIAMTLGLIVIAGLAQIYVGGRSANHIIDSNTFLNENGRFAIEYLSRAARFAGYYSCGDNSVSVRNVVDGDSFWFDYEQGAESYRVGVNTLPSAITDITTPRADTDVLVLRYADITDSQIIGEANINQIVSIISFSEPHAFNTGDIAVLNTAACDQTTFFQVTSQTNNDGSYTIGYADGSAVSPGNCTTELSGSGDCGDLTDSRALSNFGTAEVHRFITQAYFIADDPVGCAHSETTCSSLQGCPTLFTAGVASGRNSSGDPEPVPVLRNVTDLQVEFGIYDDSAANQGEAQATRYVPSSSSVDWNDVISLRLSLQVRADLRNDEGDCPSAEFSTTVYFRNAPSATPGRRPMLY